VKFFELILGLRVEISRLRQAMLLLEGSERFFGRLVQIPCEVTRQKAKVSQTPLRTGNLLRGIQMPEQERERNPFLAQIECAVCGV
jgi:hypothetical protein